MGRRNRGLSSAMAAVFTLLVAVAATAGLCHSAWGAVDIPTEAGSMEGQTVILHTSNTHGRAIADEEHQVLGFGAVSALKKAYEAAGANVLLVDAGDTLHGLPFATLTKGADIVTLMNMAGYDAMTPGNQDFSYGSAYLPDIARRMNFPLISSNVRKDNGKDLFQPSVVIDKNGVRYGLFGLSTPKIPSKTAPSNVENVEFINPFDTAKRQVANLKAQHVDMIIAVTHLGLEQADEYSADKLAKEVDGIDVIIDGQSHIGLAEGQLIGNTMLAAAGEYLQNIGVVVIDAGRGMSAGLITQEDFTEKDSSIEMAAGKINSAQKEILSEAVGTTAVYLEGSRSQVRIRETNLGDLAADVMRVMTGADAALLNGGSIASGISQGEITKGDIISVFPYGNYVVTKKVKGSVLKSVLEKSLAAYPEPIGGFLQVSGIQVIFDSAAPAGSRVQKAVIGGRELSESSSYLVAVNDYLAAGGDGYEMLRDLPIVNEWGSLEEGLTNHFAQAGEVTVSEDGRITDMQGPPPQKEPEIYIVQPGDSLWKIARAHYGDGNRWIELFQRNQDRIQNPNRIRVGLELELGE